VSDLMSHLFAAALVNNVVLVQFLGLSALFAYTRRLHLAIELAWAGFIIMFLSAVLNLLLQRYVLQPLNLDVLQLLCFVLVSASLTALLLSLAERYLPVMLRRQGLEFYLLSGNSAIVGISLLNADRQGSLLDEIASSFGAALGFALLLVLFAALRERLDLADIPRTLRGAPIHLISAGLVSMCLLGFAGVV